MSRRKDPALEPRKKDAIELRLKGVRPKKISDILKSRYNVRHSSWVIGKWLREARVNELVRKRIEDLSTKKKAHEVAGAVGLTTRQVQRILQELRGPARERKTCDQNVNLFLSDPDRYMKADFTQNTAFGRTLLRKCDREVENDPIESLAIIKPSFELFSRIKITRRTDLTVRQALCNYVQIQGIEARVYELIGQEGIASQKLSKAMEDAGDCIACKAEELWRFGRLYRTMRRWPEAFSSIRDALDRYEILPDCGHDLMGNGTANCMLVRTLLAYDTDSPQLGAMEARDALKTMTGKESPDLFGELASALAKCLLSANNPTELAKTEEVLGWCLQNYKLPEYRSITRVFLYLLQGHLSAVKGRRDDAIDRLTLALEDTQACKREREVGVILADLGTLDPDPRNIRSRIEDFCEWDDDRRLILPPWCQDLGPDILFLYDLTLNSTTQIDLPVFVALRGAAGGESLMPSFILPPSLVDARRFLASPGEPRGGSKFSTRRKKIDAPFSRPAEKSNGSHLSIEDLIAYRDANLAGSEVARIRDHFNVCNSCIDRFLDLFPSSVGT